MGTGARPLAAHNTAGSSRESRECYLQFFLVTSLLTSFLPLLNKLAQHTSLGDCTTLPTSTFLSVGPFSLHSFQSPWASLMELSPAATMNADLPERFRGQRRAQHQPELPPNFELKLNLDIRKYVHKQEQISNSALEGTWSSLTEIPTSAEVALAQGDEVELVPNKRRGKWKNKERYLKAHYELLREDAVSPLRDAVDKIRRDPDMTDDPSMSVYEKVKGVLVAASIC